jgi:Tol biopolymer transport system component
MRCVLALVALAACGRVRFDPIASSAGDTGVSPRCTGPFTWSAPQTIAALSSPFIDESPAVSPDGQTMVFASNRGPVNYELFESQLQGGTWSAPAVMTAIDMTNGLCLTTDPAWSSTLLYFVYEYCAGIPNLSETAPPFASETAVNGLTSVKVEGPTLSIDELELFYTFDPSSNEHIARATRATVTDPWSDQGLVPELSSMLAGWPTLAADGLTLYFEGRTAVGAPTDIYVTTRDAVGSPFGPPALVPVIDTTTFNEGDPEISRDCETLYFATNQPGNTDIWYATRSN